MSEDSSARRLAAILSADVVGYSRLMAADEAGTVERLKACRDAMGSLIRQHGGRVVDAVGDNLLGEFPSVVDAVACSVAVQEELAERNQDMAQDEAMRFRIGINLGDVIADEERIYGDVVNIAARIEALAQPGGVSISGTAFDHVEGKLGLDFEDQGEHEVKNIPRPVRVYRVRTSAASEQAARQTVPGFGGRPAIAVLAFDNLSRDPDQDYFAEGISEDLITLLSCGRVLPVISRNSSFAYKGRAVDVKQVGRELGVRYVVEGSVRRAGDRVRVSAQLVDATTGHHVWAERYDRDLSDIFAVQDEITETIAGAIEPALGSVERRRALAKPPQSLDAWDLYQRASYALSSKIRERQPEARALCERVLELDPGFSDALTTACFTHVLEIFNQWSDDLKASIDEALRLGERSVALDPDNARSHDALGWACIFDKRIERALEEFQRSIALNPNSAWGHWGLGAALYSLGRPDEAVAAIEKAIRLSPQDSNLSFFLQNLGMAHFVAGRYEDAAAAARRALALRPEQPAHHRLLAACCGHLGRLDEARAELAELEQLDSDFSLATYRFLNPIVAEDVIEGWRKAGWRERGSGTPADGLAQKSTK